jgi:hypothetical protein
MPAFVFEGIHKVVVRQVVLVIPFIDADFVGLIRIGFSDNNSSVRPVSRSLAEIDDTGNVAGRDVVGRVLPFSGNDIPKAVLTEEALSFVRPTWEIFGVERLERDNGEFEVEMLGMFVRHFGFSC